jgi:hypothetical protein
MIAYPETDMEVRDNNGITPFLIACSMDGNLECVKLCLERTKEHQKSEPSKYEAVDNSGNGWELWTKGLPEKVEFIEAWIVEYKKKWMSRACVVS